MNYLPDSFLSDVGLAELPAGARDGYLQRFRAELEMAVGRRVVAGLDAARIAEFEEVHQAGDAAAEVAWLERNAPGYRDIVADELAKLAAKVRDDAEAILALESLVEGSDVAGAIEPDAWPDDEAAREARQRAARNALLERVWSQLRDEFGRCVQPLEAGKPVVLHLPGTGFPTIAYLSSDETLTVQTMSRDDVDLDQPGVATFLLETNAKVIFGHLQRMGKHGVSVTQSVYVDGLTGAQLRRVVLSVLGVATDVAAALGGSTGGDAS